MADIDVLYAMRFTSIEYCLILVLYNWGLCIKVVMRVQGPPEQTQVVTDNYPHTELHRLIKQHSQAFPFCYRPSPVFFYNLKIWTKYPTLKHFLLQCFYANVILETLISGTRIWSLPFIHPYMCVRNPDILDILKFSFFIDVDVYM